MFYLIKNNQVQCANYKFNDDCTEYTHLTMEEYVECPNKFIIKDDALVINPDYNKEKQEQEKQERIAEIKNLLNEIDLKSIRAIRSNDKEYLEKYEKEAEELREELHKLEEEIK